MTPHLFLWKYSQPTIYVVDTATWQLQRTYDITPHYISHLFVLPHYALIMKNQTTLILNLDTGSLYKAKKKRQISQLDNGTLKSVSRSTNNEYTTFTVQTIVVHNNDLHEIATFKIKSRDTKKRMPMYCAGRCYFITESYTINIYNMQDNNVYRLDKRHCIVHIRGDDLLTPYFSTPVHISDQLVESATTLWPHFLKDKYYGVEINRQHKVYDRQNKELYCKQDCKIVTSSDDFIAIYTVSAKSTDVHILDIRNGEVVKSNLLTCHERHWFGGVFASFSDDAAFKRSLYNMVARYYCDVVLFE